MQNDKDLLYPKYRGENAERLKRIMDSPSVLPENKEHCKKFILYCMSNRLSQARLNYYLSRLPKFAEFAKKDFKNLEPVEVDEFIAKINETSDGWNTDAYKVMLRLMYRHMYGLTSRDQPPEPARHLKRVKPPNKLRPQDLLRADEEAALIGAARTIKLSAGVGTLIETGMRPGEFRGLKVGDIVFGKHSIKITINFGKMAGRTGPRSSFIIRNYDSLKLWFDQHPFKNNPNAWLFGDDQKPMTDYALRMAIKRLAVKAGIKKNVFTYLLRHDFGTRNYKKNPELARRLMGHAAGSKMAQVYCHLGDEDLEKMLLEQNGIEIDEKKEETGICARCQHMNPVGVQVCNKCGMALTTEAAISVEAEERFTKEDLYEEMRKFLVSTSQEELIQMKQDVMPRQPVPDAAPPSGSEGVTLKNLTDGESKSIVTGHQPKA
jgi:integrase/recombinase XerD